MGKVIGIDLGTTYSAVAYLNKEDAEIIPDKNGKRTMPSVVSFADDVILAGEAARSLEYTNPEFTVKRIKRKMGTDFKVKINDKEYSPEEISSFILKKLKDQAEEFLGEKVKDAIITVPAYFNDNQRQATKNAGKLAGLNVLRIINEPTAASLAYVVNSQEDLNIVIYDLGGGTLDVSVLNVADGIFEVISTAGDNNLGGEDFNKRIMDSVIGRFKDETGIDLNEDPLAIVKIYDAVEKAKIELSSEKSARIKVPFITADQNGPKNIDFELTRPEFESMIADYIQRSIDLCRQAVSDADFNINEIDRVILVGGSSRIPMVRESVGKLFGKSPDCSINPDEVVARGAALQGGIVQGDVSGVVLVDVNPISLGIEVESGYFVPIIERNSPIPTSAKRIFTTVVSGQKSVDIHIMQGESMYCKNNVSLGKFRLEGIRNTEKGDPRIEVNFELDVNGILNVSAMDVDTQNVQGITIVEQSRMSEEELLKIQQEHMKRYEGEIKLRGNLNSVLKLKTRAESIITKIANSIPPAYKKGLIQEEIDEIIYMIDLSVRDMNPEGIEKSIERLEFMMTELTAGTYSYGEMIA